MADDRSTVPMHALLNVRESLLADVDRTVGAPERLLVLSNRSGTQQLGELIDGELMELTALPEPVDGAHYIPDTRRAVLEVAAGGNERDQLYVIDLTAAAAKPVTGFDQLRALTAMPDFGHHVAGVSGDGTRLAYLCNRANGVDFDLWCCDLASGEQRLLWASGGYCIASSGFSPDDRYVALLRFGSRPLDTDLLLVDVEAGEARLTLPHPEEAALVGDPAWIDATSFYAPSNV
ncbi:MAG: TolB family protein, partial [Solirubrobacteraceae bacterium]